MLIKNHGSHHCFFLIFLFVISSLKLTHAHAAWIEQVVDTSVDARQMSIDIDNSGFVHVGYFDDATERLYYARFNGTGWSIQNLDSGATAGQFLSLELNAQGYARISYARAADLRYASFDGTGWSFQTADSGADAVGGSTSLALDANGYAHVSYWDITNDQLKYASFNGTSWNVQALDPAGDFAQTSLSLDANGYAQIGYYDPTNEDLKFAQFNGTGWSFQVIDSLGNVGQDVSIALNGNQYARLSYFDADNTALRYAAWNGAGWDIQVLDTNIAGIRSSITLDSHGYAYISYLGSPDGGTTFDLRLAYFNGTGWELETIYSSISPDSGGDPRDTSLALFNDYAYITYAQQQGYLAITTNAPQGFVPEPTLDILGRVLFFGIPGLLLYARKK